jgi:integrase
MDRVIAAAHSFAEAARTRSDREAWTWRARMCTVLRFTGLRVDEQVLQLRWDDVDLESAELYLRGELGKSQAERSGRTLPLAPQLVELMAGWGVREGWLVAPSKNDRHADPRHTAQLWRAAEVPERVWGAGPGRHKARVHHAFRAGFKTGLSRLGIASEVRDYLVGHHRGVDEHYLDTYAQARAAVRELPRLTCDHSVIRLDPRRKATGGKPTE